jgi:hypothetical protein
MGEQLIETNRLDSREIDLVSRVSQLNYLALHYIYSLRNLYFTAQSFPYIQSLEWLKQKGIIGDLLVDWMESKHGKSPLKAAMFLRQMVCNENEPRPLMARQQ